MATSLHALLPTEGISSPHPSQLSRFFKKVFETKAARAVLGHGTSQAKGRTRGPHKQYFSGDTGSQQDLDFRRKRKSTPSNCVCFED